MNPDRLGGKVAIVTGAGSGVGQAVAVALADAGVRSLLVGRRREALAETAALVEASGGESIVAPGNVADEFAVQAAVESATEAWGGVDLLVASAGISIPGPVEGYPLKAWKQTLATNLTGVFLYCRAVLPLMRQRGGGAIVAISSGAGKQGYPNLAAYSASKFGLIGLMQSIAAEVDGSGIKVSSVVPGSILTNFGTRTLKERLAAQEDGAHFLLPEDVAEAVLYLLRLPPHAWTQELNLWPIDPATPTD